MQVELEEVVLNKGELKHWVELDSFRYNALVYYVIILSLIETPETERKGELMRRFKRLAIAILVLF